MFDIRKYSLAFSLLTVMALIAGCGGSESRDGETYLEDITVPQGFDFSTTKTADITIDSDEHGLSQNAFVKVALDDQYTIALYLGPLDDTGGLTMCFTVPSKTTALYYKVYESDAIPFEGKLPL